MNNDMVSVLYIKNQLLAAVYLHMTVGMSAKRQEAQSAPIGSAAFSSFLGVTTCGQGQVQYGAAV